MSKYYKAEDVINLLATEYYTYKQAEIIEVEDCKAAAIFNTRHLPTIEIVRCKDCARRKTWDCPFYRAGYTYKDNDFCSDGERRGNE